MAFTGNNRRAVAKLLTEARAELAAYGVNMDLYDMGAIENLQANDNYVCDVVFTMLTTPGTKVQVSTIWPDDNGHMMQFGRNYGILSL